MVGGPDLFGLALVAAAAVLGRDQGGDERAVVLERVLVTALGLVAAQTGDVVRGVFESYHCL